MELTVLLETLQQEAFSMLENIKANVPREVQLPTAENMMKVVVGMRRTGKTSYLYQEVNRLLAQGVSLEQILIINFEDERLLPMTAKEMGALLDAFYSLYPHNHDRRCFLFLDEVQNIPDWHLVVRRYFETKQVQLYLTGSSSKLLSKEINTSLRGRSLSVEVLPYSFREYMAAHMLQYPERPFGQKSFDIAQRYLLDYFSRGGFPAVQLMPKNEWRLTLQGYVETVVLKDIVERHGVTNIALLKYLAATLIKNAATIFSVNKFFNDVRSQGYKVSKDTLHLYMNYLEDAFLIFVVPFYSESDRVKQSRSKKIYAIDSGLVNASSLKINQLYNKFFENLIYLDLRRQGKKVFFYHTQDGYEVDFVTIDSEGKKELLQACWDMSDEKTASRELRALESAQKELKIKGRVVTPRDYLRDCFLQ